MSYSMLAITNRGRVWVPPDGTEHKLFKLYSFAWSPFLTQFHGFYRQEWSLVIFCASVQHLACAIARLRGSKGNQCLKILNRRTAMEATDYQQQRGTWHRSKNAQQSNGGWWGWWGWWWWHRGMLAWLLLVHTLQNVMHSQTLLVGENECGRMHIVRISVSILIVLVEDGDELTPSSDVGHWGSINNYSPV